MTWPCQTQRIYIEVFQENVSIPKLAKSSANTAGSVYTAILSKEPT